MGSPALNWTLAAIAVLVAVVSTARLAAADSREARFAAGGDLVMAGGMAAMFLPATAASFGDHSMWWVAAFSVVGLGGVALSVRHARLHGWRDGRRWAHHIIGSAAMVIMTLAMPGTDSAPVLALGGHSMAGMTHGHGHGSAETSDATETAGMAGMEGTGHSSGMTAHDMTTGATHSASAGDSASVWRVVLIALAVYFLISIVTSVWARLRGTDPPAGGAAARAKAAGRDVSSPCPTQSWCSLRPWPSPSGTRPGWEVTSAGHTQQRATGTAVARRVRRRPRP